MNDTALTDQAAGTAARVRLRAQPLVGRERELALVDHVLDTFAAREQPRLIVSGEPGIGKSALLRELRALAAARGLRSVAGVGDEVGRETPLGLFADALGDLLGEHDVAALDSAARVATTLERIAADEPLVLVLDDLQWADDASLSLLARLLRRPPRQVLLVLAHRSGDLPGLLTRAVGLTPADGELHRLELATLAPGAAALLLDGIAPVRGRQILHESGGNPFYLSQLAASARADGGSPLTLRAALVAELTALSPTAAALVRAAGLLGDRFDPQLAAAVAGLPPQEASRALVELVSADLVRTTERPERCAFRRPVIAAVVRDWAGGAWRMAAHARAAELLAAAGASASERARHVERSARPGDSAAVELLAAAGAELLQRDPRGAAHWFGAAVRLLRPDEKPAQRLELLLNQAVALAGGGSFEAARTPLVQALELLPRVPPQSRARALAPLARVEAMVAQHPEALELLRRSEVADAPELHTMTAMTQWFAGAWGPMATSARRALQRASRGEPAVHAQAAALLSIAERQLGHTAAAHAALAEAEWAAHGCDELDVSPDSLASLGAAAEMLDRHETSLRYFARLLEVARTSRQEFFVVPALAGQTGAQLRLGRLLEAERTATEAVEASREVLNPRASVLAHAHACRVALARGDVEAAVGHGEKAAAAVSEAPSAVYRELALCFLAAARLAAGELDRGVDELLAAAGGPALERVPPTWRTHWASVVATAELGRRRVGAARAWSERAAVLAVAVGSTGAFAEAERTRARVLLVDGDATGAQLAASHAVEGFEAIGRHVEAAISGALLGQALARGGDSIAGVERLRRAYGTLGSAGARLERDAAARALRRLGQRMPARGRAPRPRSGVAALSLREREIAALVATGATNRQIAEQLVISEKTVESHLTRIFTKLGVSSRTAAAHVLSIGIVPD